MNALLSQSVSDLRGQSGGQDLHDCEDDIGFVPDRCEGNRGDHDDHEVESPISTRRQCIGWSSDSKRHNLGRVKPGHAQPANGEKCVEDEQKCGSDDARL